MAIDWLNGFFIPLAEIIFILAVVFGLGFLLIRFFRKTWKTQTKWLIRYKILKKPYPEDAVRWILNNIEHGIGYYDTKKMLLVKGVKPDKINGIMFIYDEILNTMKGGQDVRKFKRSYSKIESTEFPTIKAN